VVGYVHKEVVMPTANVDRRAASETRALVPGKDEPTPWEAARERLETAEMYRTYWLTTLHADGHPHSMPILGLWLDGVFYFLTGENTRKGENLGRDGRCVLTVNITSLPALDISAEGSATRVADEATLRRVVDAYGSELHWPLELRDGRVDGPNAPTAGPPPYAVWALTPATVFGLPGVAGTDEQGQARGAFVPTRWRFTD
jgi:hypothetical protein